MTRGGFPRPELRRPELRRPEFYRPERRSALPAKGALVEITARPEECRALAERFGLPAIHALACGFHLQPEADGTVLAAARLTARFSQVCVISLEVFEATLAEDFILRFVPEGTESDIADPAAIDEIALSGGTLDLGEAAAEQFALLLDPYPRAPGARLPEGYASPDDTTEAGGDAAE